MKRKLPILILVLILSVVIISAFLFPPDPDRCALCDLAPCHAPYLINLNTGEAGILEVYNINQIRPTELDSWQQGGTFSFVTVAGLQGYRDTANWEVHIPLPEEPAPYKTANFCKACRKLIKPFKQDGYIIADCYDSTVPTVYSISLQAPTCFRNYEISCVNNVTGTTEMVVRGMYYP